MTVHTHRICKHVYALITFVWFLIIKFVQQCLIELDLLLDSISKSKFKSRRIEPVFDFLGRSKPKWPRRGIKLFWNLVSRRKNWLKIMQPQAAILEISAMIRIKSDIFCNFSD